MKTLFIASLAALPMLAQSPLQGALMVSMMTGVIRAHSALPPARSCCEP